MAKAKTETNTHETKTTAITPYEYNPQQSVANTDGLRGLLAAMEPKIATVLPKHVTADRILKAVLSAAIRNPKLFECTQESVVEALMRASQLGLDPSGTLGSAYLVPYGKVCTFIPGYRGLIDLARRSNEIDCIEAHAVYDQDEFDVVYGTKPRLVHKPYLGGDRTDSFRAFYAVGTLKGGNKQIEVMTLADVERIRVKSKMGERGPWKEHYSEMGRKTVVRRLCKYLPMSTELEKALEYDNEADGFDIKTVDVAALQTTDRTADLARRLSGEKPPEESKNTPDQQETGQEKEEAAQVNEDALAGL